MTNSKYLFFLGLIFLFAQCATLKNATSGTFKDKRDGQTYKWVRLKDGKKWMAQNLNYKTVDSWCYDNDATNCAEYGRLYNWDAALKACPKGWRLPSEEEWQNMISHYGIAKILEKRKRVSLNDIRNSFLSNGNSSNRATRKEINEEEKVKKTQKTKEEQQQSTKAYKALMQGGGSGFSAELVGLRFSDGRYHSANIAAGYWTNTSINDSKAWKFIFLAITKSVLYSKSKKKQGSSCRCLQDYSFTDK